jgi:hypothetical protein
VSYTVHIQSWTLSDRGVAFVYFVAIIVVQEATCGECGFGGEINYLLAGHVVNIRNTQP